MLLNAPKCQGYSFYHFWVIKGKPIGGDSPQPRLGLTVVFILFVQENLRLNIACLSCLFYREVLNDFVT